MRANASQPIPQQLHAGQVPLTRVVNRIFCARSVQTDRALTKAKLGRRVNARPLVRWALAAQNNAAETRSESETPNLVAARRQAPPL